MAQSGWLVGWGHYIMWHHIGWQGNSAPAAGSNFLHIKGWIIEKGCTLFLPPPEVSITVRGRLNIWPLMSFRRQVQVPLRPLFGNLADPSAVIYELHKATFTMWFSRIWCSPVCLISRELPSQATCQTFWTQNTDQRKGNLNIYTSTYLIDLLFSHDLPQKPCKGNSRG